jgi:phosphomethylpyrimidine synthase
MNKEEKISRTPFPNSTKIYVSGEIHPIKVAMRELAKTTRKCPMVVSIRPLLFTTRPVLHRSNIEIDIR